MRTSVLLRVLFGLAILDIITLLFLAPDNRVEWIAFGVLNLVGIMAVGATVAIPKGKSAHLFGLLAGGVGAVAVLTQLFLIAPVLSIPGVEWLADRKRLRWFLGVELLIVAIELFALMTVLSAARRTASVIAGDEAGKTFARRAAHEAQALADRLGLGPVRDKAVAVAEALRYAPTATSGAVAAIEQTIEGSLLRARQYIDQGNEPAAEAELGSALAQAEERTRQLRWQQ
jgi:hypothetical protein